MDYWESGMDMKRGDDIYDSFRTYQGKLLREYSVDGRRVRLPGLDARRPDRSHPGGAAAPGPRVPVGTRQVGEGPAPDRGQPLSLSKARAPVNVLVTTQQSS